MKQTRLLLRGVRYIMKDKAFEILRLWEKGMNKTRISQSVKVHRQTTRDYISRAKAAEISSTELKEMSDEKYREIFCVNIGGRKKNKSAIDFEYIDKERKKAGVTLLLLWEEQLTENPESCCYSTFCERYQHWKKKQNVSMRISHKAGEKCFVDYSGKRFPIYNKDKPDEILFEAEIFVGVLGASNYTYLEASEDQKLANWIGSHVRMFEYFGGVTEITVPDNLKSGVTKADYYEPSINRTYHDFATHYGTAVIPARPGKPKDKAKAENGVQQVQRRVLAVLRKHKFFSIEELNIALKKLMEVLNQRLMKSYGKSRSDLYLELDKPALKPLPVIKYEFSTYKLAKVNIDYHIEVSQHYYSVPYQHVGEQVDVKINEKLVEIYFKGQRIALHPRSLEKARYSTIKEHMPAKHRYMEKWNPMRFLEWAGNIGPETKIQINSILHSRKVSEQTYRNCLGVLDKARTHGNFKLEQACKVANQFGAVSIRSMKNIIEKNRFQQDSESPPPVVHSNIRGDTEFH